MSNLPDLSQYFSPDIVARFAEVAQPRSNFQLEKFVIGQHDTAEQQYIQCLNEIQAIYYKLKEASLNQKKSQIKLNKLRETKDEIDEIDAQILELEMEQTGVVAVGAIRELEELLKYLDKFPRYTREEIENAQVEYWQKRLTRQLETEQAASGSQSIASHLNSLIQIGAIKFEMPQIDNELKKEIK